MANQNNYSDTHKYSNHKSFDGQPVPEGMVLVPIQMDEYQFDEDEYVPDNLITMHFGEFKYKIGFIPIPEKGFETYMKGFWAEINYEMKHNRLGRCIIGYKPDGSKILCHHSKRCSKCTEKDIYERYNPNRVQILSINYEYDGESFDYEDKSLKPVEDQVIEQNDKPLEDLLSRLDEDNPRYAQIIRLKLAGKSIDEICVEINLKPSRGRQEINNAHDEVCDRLELRHHKKNRR